MNPVVYGLPNCDTCKKARNWLARFEVAHDFVDYRANPVPAATLKDWAAQLGGWEKLVNKSSTTWRNLLPQRKNPGSDPEWTLRSEERRVGAHPRSESGAGSVGDPFHRKAIAHRVRSYRKPA